MNSTSQMALCFERGGSLAVYPVSTDTYWNRPGLYGDNYEFLGYTEKIRDFNTSIGKIEAAAAAALLAERSAFNIDGEVPLGGYTGTKTFSGTRVVMESSKGNAPVGFAAKKDGYVYVAADMAAVFTVSGAVSAEYGGFNQKGEWVKEGDCPNESSGDGYRVTLKTGQGVRFQLG